MTEAKNDVRVPTEETAEETSTLQDLEEDLQESFTEPSKKRPIVGLISAKNPVMAIVTTVESLFAGGAYRVVVVDDGSDEQEALEAFDEVERRGGTVIHLPENIGKSRALRIGFEHLESTEPGPFSVAQVDDDTIANDMSIPAKMIDDGKADIVDIRVESLNTTAFIGALQQLNYWLTNAIIKRLQDWVRARLWLSGASVMYTSEAARVMLMMKSLTQTEDTEGRFRAVSAGLRVRYCASKKAQFLTMVPESFTGMTKQWKRWALGNAQVIRLHGLGGGSAWIAFIHVLSWIFMLTGPFMQLFIGDRLHLPYAEIVPGDEVVQEVPYVGNLLSAMVWMVLFGTLIGIIGGISLRRFRLAFIGWLMPVLGLYWAYHAVRGLVVSIKHPLAESMTWEPPKRMDSKKLTEAA